jgi:hypothetical protein
MTAILHDLPIMVVGLRIFHAERMTSRRFCAHPKIALTYGGGI